MFYFYLRDGEDLADVDGTELPDIDAAARHAATVARELMFKSDGMLQRDWSRWTMSVRDSAGQELLSFALVDFMEARSGDRPVN